MKLTKDDLDLLIELLLDKRARLISEPHPTPLDHQRLIHIKSLLDTLLEAPHE